MSLWMFFFEASLDIRVSWESLFSNFFLHPQLNLSLSRISYYSQAHCYYFVSSSVLVSEQAWALKRTRLSYFILLLMTFQGLIRSLWRRIIQCLCTDSLSKLSTFLFQNCANFIYPSSLQSFQSLWSTTSISSWIYLTASFREISSIFVYLHHHRLIKNQISLFLWKIFP